MKKFILAAALALISASALAQTNNTYPLAKYQPGFRTINGSQLNSMVGEVNALTGNGASGLVGPAPLANTYLQIVNTSAAGTGNTRAEIDAFAGIPILSFRRADGTKAAPTAVQSGEEIGTVNGWGFGATTYGTTGSARLSFFATENFSETAHGSKIILSTTANTTTTLTDQLVIDQNGTATFTGIVAPLGGVSAAKQGSQALTVFPRNINSCGVPATLTTSGTDTANAAATDTYISEIYIPANISSTGTALFNGTTQNGNVTLYLADSAGNQVAHTASTASSGATQYQRIAWVGGPIAVNGPGTYFLYFQNSATSNSWRTFVVGNCATQLSTGTVYGTFPAVTVPTTFTTNVGPIAGLY